MTKPTAVLPSASIPPVVRRSEAWRHLSAAIEELGLAVAVGRAKKHWFVEFSAGQAIRKHFFSVTPSDPRSVKNNVSTFRQLVRTAQEAA